MTPLQSIGVVSLAISADRFGHLFVPPELGIDLESMVVTCYYAIQQLKRCDEIMLNRSAIYTSPRPLAAFYNLDINIELFCYYKCKKRELPPGNHLLR